MRNFDSENRGSLTVKLVSLQVMLKPRSWTEESGKKPTKIEETVDKTARLEASPAISSKTGEVPLTPSRIMTAS